MLDADIVAFYDKLHCLLNRNILQRLCYIQVGNIEASNRYTKHKRKVADEIGIRCDYINLPSSTTQDQVSYIRLILIA